LKCLEIVIEKRLTLNGFTRTHRDSVGTTVSSLAQSTACLWSDQRTFMIRRLVHYFSGRRAARSFSASGMSDISLRDMVNAKIPYVDQLMLCADRFVLKDIELAAVDPPRVDIRYQTTIVVLEQC